jgi:hypothetical protein
MTPTEALLLTADWTDLDLYGLREVAKELGADVLSLATVISLEGRGAANARNPSDPKAWPLAVGPIQITRIAAQGMGRVPIPGQPWKGRIANVGDQWSEWKAYADKSVTRPIAWHLGEMLDYYRATPRGKTGAGFPSDVQLYAANAAAAAGDTITDATIIYPAGSDAYRINRALDLDDSGDITGKDLRLATEYARNAPIFKAFAARLAALP